MNLIIIIIIIFYKHEKKIFFFSPLHINPTKLLIIRLRFD